MPASIGINLRVTGHCRQGGRKYMEDCFSVAYQQTDDERDLEYAFFGIYDGHGGAEAASFAKEHLMDIIVRHKSFWSDNDEDVLKAIKDGYIATHYAMWKEQEKWPKTASGLPSTAGTTASVAFIRRGKIYIGHVGDSGIILGYQDPGSSDWKAQQLTKDHKPENLMEMTRIEQSGGKVVAKSGVPRVVWNRPKIGHKGPVRRSTPIDEIPFLAVARSLGDLWSYNSNLDEFVVSPEPDCSVIQINTDSFRCLIFGTDGLYNMLSPQMAVNIVQQAEKHNENSALSDIPNKIWLNPSKCLVEKALERWSSTKMRADNTTVVTIMLDPPGPPRAQVLKNRKRNYSDGGLQIVTRYENQTENENQEVVRDNTNEPVPSCSSSSTDYPKSFEPREEKSEISCSSSTKNFVPEEDFSLKKPILRESLVFHPNDVENIDSNEKSKNNNEENIQINEISSSSNDYNVIDFFKTDDYSKLRLTKRGRVGKTRRILNSSENLRIKENITKRNVEYRMQMKTEDAEKKTVISEFASIINEQQSRVVTRSKNFEVKKKSEKENNTPKKELLLEKIEVNTRLSARKRTLESVSGGKTVTKRSKFEAAITRKVTRQSLKINENRAEKYDVKSSCKKQPMVMKKKVKNEKSRFTAAKGPKEGTSKKLPKKRVTKNMPEKNKKIPLKQKNGRRSTIVTIKINVINTRSNVNKSQKISTRSTK